MVTVVDVPSVGPDIGFSFRTVAMFVTGGNGGSLLLGGSDVVVPCIGTEEIGVPADSAASKAAG